jgi:lipopolysaccharide transport system ATP-binding protein
MSETVIRVQNLSKQYRIGAREGYKTFRETLVDAVKAPLQGLGGLFTRHSSLVTRDSQTIWALKDVSFEVKQGEVLGIIGRNGAGKSTLLKILSRITEPTEGRVELRGRVGSLLEVGTGFHPELTGHENIYLYGAILGMDRWEVTRKFDEIVAFAELEKFIDTPVKKYSSGMYMRLAFAVAAHLEPEILLVDEVLAVGDAAFQKKCLGKIEDVGKGGRTVLFVSHDMSAIERLCRTALLIDFGNVANAGETHEVVSSYLSQNRQLQVNPLSNCNRKGNGKIRIMGFHLEDPEGKTVDVAQSGSPAVFAFEFKNLGCSASDRISCSFSVHTDRERGIFHYYSHFSGIYYRHLPPSGYFKCLIPELPLAPGNYLIMCRVVMNGDHRSGEEADWPQVFVPFSVIGGDFYGTGDANLSTWGPIHIKGKWF